MGEKNFTQGVVFDCWVMLGKLFKALVVLKCLYSQVRINAFHLKI
jgi:hypothetical protein